MGLPRTAERLESELLVEEPTEWLDEEPGGGEEEAGLFGEKVGCGEDKVLLGGALPCSASAVGLVVA